MTDATALDCGIEGVEGDGHDEESRRQVANVEQEALSKTSRGRCEDAISLNPVE